MVDNWRNMLWGDLATLEYGKALRGYGDGVGTFRVFGTNGPIGWHWESLCGHPTVVVGRKGAYRGIHYSAEPCYVIDTLSRELSLTCGGRTTSFSLMTSMIWIADQPYLRLAESRFTSC